MRKPGGCEIQLAQVGVQLAGAEQAELEVCGLADVAQGEGDAQRGDAGEADDQRARPEIRILRAQERLGREGDDEAVQPALGEHRLVVRLTHAGRATKPR